LIDNLIAATAKVIIWAKIFWIFYYSPDKNPPSSLHINDKWPNCCLANDFWPKLSACVTINFGESLATKLSMTDMASVFLGLL
jgi:hypothetical protein